MVRLKVQQKLQSWLTKYDNEIGEKSKELYRLKDQLDKENHTFIKWKEEFDRQEIEFSSKLFVIEINNIYSFFFQIYNNYGRKRT